MRLGKPRRDLAAIEGDEAPRCKKWQQIDNIARTVGAVIAQRWPIHVHKIIRAGRQIAVKRAEFSFDCANSDVPLDQVDAR
jgi:hypothetical protein